MIKKEVRMNLPQKKILINNFLAVEQYLELEVRENPQLRYVELNRNRHIAKVNELLEQIPESYHPAELQRFFEKTGLTIRVEIHNSAYEVTTYDRNGRYPREDAVIWNKDFVEQISKHPEWLDPQEEADLLIRWIFPVESEEDIEKIHLVKEYHIIL